MVSSNQATLRLMAVVSTGRTSSVEVWNVNDEARPARVAEFTAVDGLVLDTNMALLRTGGPLPSPHRDRLVLAHWYPWWEPVAWASPQLLDQPLRLYSTDSAADVARNMQDVANAGIDAVIVSWQGSDVGGGWNLRRLRYVLDGAQQAGLKVTVHLETLAANRVGREGATPDPDVLTAWIAELVDTLATHPAWLKVDGRPGHPRLRLGIRRRRHLAHGAGPRPRRRPQSAADRRLHQPGPPLAGRRAGDLLRHAVLAGRRRADARHRVRGPDLPPARRGLRQPAHRGGHGDARLRRNAARRVAPAASSARVGGEFYDRQWQAALASGADWVVISTWNEWAENTQVEAGQRFGEFYVWRTRFWSAALKTAPR